ncbi:MAG: MinD/ParA family protein, partial [Peptococcaceae bacterium]|nr:MinD/ParA family protein [Peptococcaceae bacterium]
FRGGTGKSNTTANLAATIARQGRRVGIVDTDIQSPGIHVLFKLDPDTIGHVLNDYLYGRCAIADAAYDVSDRLRVRQGEIAAVSGACFLIPSSMQPGEIARILREGYDVELLNDGYRELIRELALDYLFIDTHPGLNEETLLSIALADVLLLVMRPDRQDFQGTAVMVEVARNLAVPAMYLVVNKALRSLDLNALKRQCETTYGVEVAGILPLSEDVARLASEDVFCIAYPEHQVSQEYRAIAARVG